MDELTGSQIVVKRRYDGRIISRPSYAKIRLMRRDPVISLIRTMLFSGVLASDWSYEIEQESKDLPIAHEIKDFISKQFTPLRLHILRNAVCGCFDFGWQPFEKVFDLDYSNLRIILKKLKPLLQDITDILTDDGTGAFVGFKNGEVTIPLELGLLVNFDVEGTMHEGQSQVELAEECYDEKKISRETALRFDAKMAGSHWVVKYPQGKSPVPGTNEERPNSEIANDILDALTSSGLIAVPQARQKTPGLNTGENAWDISLLTADGSSITFTDRFQYHDKSIARVLGWPERAILEGQYGTKADATAHGDFVITMIEYRHDCILQMINWHLVNHLIRMNWGAQYENVVFIKAARLDESTRARLLDIYMKVLESPDGALTELDALDLENIAEQLGIPRKSQDQIDEMTPEPEPEPSTVAVETDTAPEPTVVE